MSTPFSSVEKSSREPAVSSLAGRAPLTVVVHEVRRDGGMERAMLETLSRLLERGWRVRVIARVCELPDHPHLDWIRIPTPRRPFVLAFPLFALVAGLRLKHFSEGLRMSLGAIVLSRVDVVVVQFCHAGFARHRIVRASRDSATYRSHARLSHFLALALERWCYRSGRVRQMIAVSDLIKRELESSYDLASIAVDVIPNGADLDRFHPSSEVRRRERRRLGLSENDHVALFVGGDWERKGLGLAIEAVASAGWSLIVAGSGDELTMAARARKLGARVFFVGHVADPEDIYCTADAFLLPSQYEGFALVTIEAAAAGLPLLVTEATGAGELAAKAGLVVLPRNAAAFAAELRRLARDPEAHAAARRRARAAAADFAWPRIVDAYDRLLLGQLVSPA